MRCRVLLVAGCALAAIALIALLQAASLSMSTYVPYSTPTPSRTHITAPAQLPTPHATRSAAP